MRLLAFATWESGAHFLLHYLNLVVSVAEKLIVRSPNILFIYLQFVAYPGLLLYRQASSQLAYSLVAIV